MERWVSVGSLRVDIKKPILSMESLLQTPMAINVGMLLTIALGGSMVWQRLEHVTQQVEQIQATLENTRHLSNTGRMSDVDRLGKIEGTLEGLRTDVQDLKQEVRNR